VKKPVLIAALLIAPLAWADTPRIVVNDAAQTTTLSCGDGGELMVNGSDNQLTVTGGCAKVVVNGAGNTIALDGADKIVVNGANNKISYKRGWKAARPRIVRTGSGNKIAKGTGSGG